ncbi:5'-methylthioadenosine/S-adenosylhomocysteine nucleosidase [Jeotgalibacillus haloalkalitolerans]|uniref:5'-methylthioadenosine/S-adenosylhomocysteine nucleosidase n=1 Tax=Jeotgalibacillus haloalkalitolerans TaxID=3104292 RepID=A0ABU5KM05_9BACL|nr:5'-methylthioadenosine/S-adenosylhomocysteine nucleosidase [Jeotgalibacillus sp. HH7-29]MDZ5712302.1 5'-methylthioadenosine/S-adenosylhomocysteine nucleosidase [Jeotgalibacillus sp. HH7-29]
MKIGIIGAMEEEVETLRSTMENVQTETIANSEFTTGLLKQKEVVLVKSGIGKVNAAMTTTILMERYQPDVIINTGSAGGFDPALNVGDVVISNEVRHHDVDVTAFNYEYGQVPGMPAAFKADDKLRETALTCAAAFSEIKSVSGLIATGDSFMNDPDRVETLQGRFEDLQALEMEAAAIAQVAHQYEVPFVIIRSLSDIAGKESHVSFDQYLKTAAVNSANLIIQITEKI